MRNYKSTIICDIDGTIADLTHRLHYINTEGKKKDWDAFHASVDKDYVHEDVRDILWSLVNRDKDYMEVIYVSGRTEKTREDTRWWLRKHVFPKGELCMRANGDYRPDCVIKEEIADKLMLTPDQVLCVLEDRDQVVQMWRKKGFRVLQVQNGNY